MKERRRATSLEVLCGLFGYTRQAYYRHYQKLCADGCGPGLGERYYICEGRSWLCLRRPHDGVDRMGEIFHGVFRVRLVAPAVAGEVEGDDSIFGKGRIGILTEISVAGPPVNKYQSPIGTFAHVVIMDLAAIEFCPAALGGLSLSMAKCYGDH